MWEISSFNDSTDCFRQFVLPKHLSLYLLLPLKLIPLFYLGRFLNFKSGSEVKRLPVLGCLTLWNNFLAFWIGVLFELVLRNYFGFSEQHLFFRFFVGQSPGFKPMHLRLLVERMFNLFVILSFVFVVVVNPLRNGFSLQLRLQEAYSWH